jgi:phytoene synthase
MFAVYAFAREVDDIADDDHPLAEKKARLAEWREEIERLYAGAPRNPTAQALARPLKDFGFAKADFLALIDGMEMDGADIRAPSLAELELYCDRVASAVGRLSVKAFGNSSPAAAEVARHLGQALQRTNILRDLVEDAGRGRLYLPREWLVHAGVDPTAAPGALLADPRTATVCARLAEDARGRFAMARAALARCDRHAMRPAVVMMEVYRRTLDALEARGWTDLGRTVRVPKAIKLWVAFRHGLL